MASGRFLLLWLLAICIFLDGHLCSAESLSHSCEFLPKLEIGSELPAATELTLTGCSLEEIEKSRGLQTLKLHYFYHDLQFKSVFENLTTLEVQTGAFKIDDRLSQMAPNLKTLTLEDVEISSVPSGAFTQFRDLRLFSIQNSNISRIEADGIKLQMHKDSKFLIVHSKIDHVIENGVQISPVAAVILENNSINIVDSRAFRIETDNLIVKGNRIEQASEHAFDIRSPKIIINENQWVSTNAQVLASVSLTLSDHPYFSLENNTFHSKTSVDVNFRQLNRFTEDILESAALSVSGNSLQCTCSFPYSLDGSMKFVEHSRSVYYKKLALSSKCHQRNTTLHGFLSSRECRATAEPELNLPPIHQPYPDIDRIMSPEYYDYEHDVNKSAESSPHESDSPHDSEPSHASDTKSTHDPDEDYAVPRKPANKPLRADPTSKDDDKPPVTTASPQNESASVVGPVVIVIIAILVLVGIIVLVFCCQKKFAS